MYSATARVRPIAPAANAPSEDTVRTGHALAQAILRNIERVVSGKRELVELALAALAAGGHLLIEDVPGLGKTMLARALARSLGMGFHRIQFTADLMPSDIVGGPIYNPKDGSFTLHPGPIFSNVVLADEINRGNPRAQSAMLECMEEGQVTLDSQTLRLPEPFLVLATQNPIDMAGTYPLPEAQLDRFMIRLSLGYPEADIEAGLIQVQQFAHPIASLEAVCMPEDFLRLQASARQVHITDEVARYITAIVRSTREHPAIRVGASPRGTLALARMARALACVRGQGHVEPSVVREIAAPVLAHRIALRAPGGQQVAAATALIDEILAAQRTPR